MVNPSLAVAREDGWITFFNASGPIFTCAEDDDEMIRLVAVLLTEPSLGLALPIQIARVLHRDRTRIHAYRKDYREGGIEAIAVKKPGPRGATKLKDTVLARAQVLLNEGKSNRKVATLVGVSEGSIRKAIKEGRLTRDGSPAEVPGKQPQQEEGAPSTPSQRSREDASCAGGVATKREDERALAPLGLIGEALPEFEAAESVAKAGVLVALPALLGQGLLEVGDAVYGKLKNGYYGLGTMLLAFGLMALMRIKSTEELTGHAPGEFGHVLGLDRAPEMKTARRKLAELAERGQALEFIRAFSERWTTEDPEALGYLYIDGHVRPYHGRKHKHPKTHVQQRRLCMPATTDYWVNDTNAEPLLFVTAPANNGLLTMMDEEVLPKIRDLAGEGRRVTLIFDREGWSPKRFKRWEQEDFDVITYRKGSYKPWQTRCFKEVTVEIHGRKIRYMLAERMVKMTKGFRLREVRRLCDDGHQTSVVTTPRDHSIEEVAVSVFSRCRQENHFKYMRQEFALDHLPTMAVEPADPERTVLNPMIKAKKKELARINSQLTKAEQAYGQKAHDNQERQRPTLRGFKISNAELGKEIKALRAERANIEAEIKALPKRVPIHEVRNGEPVVQLERERKIITDTIKMVAYRAETQLANLVGPLLPCRDDEARKFMRQVFNLPADLFPNYEQRTHLVRLHSMTTPRHNRALGNLCAVVNELGVFYPGTSLKLVLEAEQVTPALC